MTSNEENGFQTKPVPDYDSEPNNNGLWITIIILNFVILTLLYVSFQISVSYGGCLADRLHDIAAHYSSPANLSPDRYDVQNGSNDVPLIN